MFSGELVPICIASSDAVYDAGSSEQLDQKCISADGFFFEAEGSRVFPVESQGARVPVSGEVQRCARFFLLEVQRCVRLFARNSKGAHDIFEWWSKGACD